MCKLKHLAVAAAIVGLATQVQAGYFPGSTDFEDNPLTNAVIWSGIDNVAEAIVPDATVPSPRPATYTPSSFSATRANVLSVDNDVTSPIICNINGGAAMPASTIYADALVKGAPLANDASVPDVGPTDKLLVYTRVNADGTDTNLCVLAKPGANSITNESVLTSTHIGKDEWHRVIIEAVNDGTYKVYCDTFDQNAALGTYYPITAGSSMSSVAFAGTGSVDDLILSDLIPEQPVYAITWDTSLASVKYTTDGITTNDLTVANGRYEFQDPDPTQITIIADNGYRTFADTYTPSSSALTHALVVPTGLAYYSDGDGSAGKPYEIPCYEALVAMKDAVAADASYRSANYIQTADIDCTGKAAFAGIGTYNATPTAGTPFTGTYDGCNYKIMNVDFTQRNYGGVFNQVNGGTIKNLTVSNITCSAFSASVNDGEWGGAIVGNAGNGATLQNLVAEGTFAADHTATHNVAGIVIRACAGGTGTLVKDCTNNATLYGAYTKIGGICAITQHKIAGGVVTFDGCVNTGDIISSRTTATGVTGYAGILGYNDDDSVLVNCSNTGSIVNNSGANTDKDGALVGWAYTQNASSIRSLTDQGGNSAAKMDKMLAFRSSLANVTGFQYATVEDDIATTIAPPYTLAKDTEYLLEGNVAASATPVFTLAAAGDTFVVNTNLEYSFAGTVDANAPLVVTSSTSGSITTYTAALTAATWVGGLSGDWDATSNWDYGILPTKDTVVTITNDAQVAIGSSRCKELVLTNANVTLVRASGVAQPILHFYSNEGRAVSVASGATGSLAVNGISLFNQRTDSADLTIGCGLEILGDLTFRGVNPGNNVSASFTITNKTTISADAIVKTIDYGTTKFLGGIEVAKGVTAKITTKPHGTAQIGTGVTLVANDGEGAATAIWLMQNEGTSRGVSLVNNASIAVDADHAGLCYVTQRSEREDYIPCDIYEVYWKRTVTVTTNGVTVAGVENGQKVVPGTNLVISVTGFVEGYEPSVTITKTADSSVLLTTNAVSFTYTMPDFDIDVSATAVKTVQSFNDPEGRLIEDYAVISWLSNNGFTQAQIDALGNNAAGTDRLYYCYLLNLNFTVQDASAALSFTEITVSNRVSMTVQLVRKAPLAGYINGALYIYGANDLAAGFSRSPIPDESVEYFTGDPSFNLVTGSNDTVTQTAVATMNTSVTAKFFKATIEVPWVDNGDEPYWEPEPDPDPDPEPGE